MKKSVLIVGAGNGLSASLSRAFHARGNHVVLVARNTKKLTSLASEVNADMYSCDVSDASAVQLLFSDLVDYELDTVIYNPSYRASGNLVDLDVNEVQKAIQVCAYGGFLVAQQGVKKMLQSGGGNILFTGASASIKGFARSAPFAMGKFALRGLAQSMARELAPQNIHVAHFVIDGGILSVDKVEDGIGQDSFLDPDEIAKNYVHVANQSCSAWTWEIELRPWSERF